MIGSTLIGGEVEALKRLKIFAAEHLRQSTKKNQSGLSGESLYGSNFSCKISPWLAMGCLSPRRMFEDLHSSGKRCFLKGSFVHAIFLKNWLELPVNLYPLFTVEHFTDL